MKKSGALARLAQIKVAAEDKELTDIYRLEVLDVLLEYINDPEIREAAEAVPLP